MIIYTKTNPSVPCIVTKIVTDNPQRNNTPVFYGYTFVENQEIIDCGVKSNFTGWLDVHIPLGPIIGSLEGNINDLLDAGVYHDMEGLLSIVP